jgi:peptide deformylase
MSENAPATAREILQMGHPMLARRALPVADPAAPSVRALVKDMIATLIEANGAGLAAPQIGVSLRVVVFQAPAARTRNADSPPDAEESYDATAPLTVLINPEIDPLTDEMDTDWEACLSVRGLMGRVPRFTHIRYRGVDLDGQLVERRASGFHARVVQHECDHLDGILYPQRMTDLKTLIFADQAEAWHAARQGLKEDVA